MFYAEFTKNDGWANYAIDDFSVLAISESFEIKDTKIISEDDLNGHIVKLRSNTTELFAIADSGSPMSFLNEKTAQRLQQNNSSAIFKNIPPEDAARNLACCNGEYIQPKGRLILVWRMESSNSSVHYSGQPKSQYTRTELTTVYWHTTYSGKTNPKGTQRTTKRRFKP